MSQKQSNVRVQVRETKAAGISPQDSLWTVVYDNYPKGIPNPITVPNVNVSTPQGQAVTVTLSAVDPTANATITFAIGTQPKDGTLSAIANNSVTYTPNATFNGIDTFTYTAADQNGLVSAQGIVTITVGTPPANSMGTLAVVNLSTKATDAQVSTWVSAIQQQVNNEVAQEWGNTVTMVIIPNNVTPPQADWYAGIFDNTDQAGALGWHAVGKNNEPLIEVFVETSQQSGVDPATVLSHEVIESIGDANADTIVQNCLTMTGQTCVMFRELCDPVENNSYQVNGTNVSDFVTKNWFVQNSQGPWDHLAATTKAFDVLSGGYMEYSTNAGQTWTAEQEFKAPMQKYREAIGEYSRWQKYKTPINERKKSNF
jgi:hypothetical protein